jgi:hypothetical protein
MLRKAMDTASKRRAPEGEGNGTATWPPAAGDAESVPGLTCTGGSALLLPLLLLAEPEPMGCVGVAGGCALPTACREAESKSATLDTTCCVQDISQQQSKRTKSNTRKQFAVSCSRMHHGNLFRVHVRPPLNSSPSSQYDMYAAHSNLPRA